MNCSLFHLLIAMVITIGMPAELIASENDTNQSNTTSSARTQVIPHNSSSYDETEKPIELVALNNSDLPIANEVEKQHAYLINKSKAVIYTEATSLTQIASIYGIDKELLRSYNNLDGNIFPAEVPIFLSKKHHKHLIKTYIIQDGDSMWQVAQTFGIDLMVLLEKNHLKKGQEPKVGEIIQLKKQAAYAPKIKHQGKYEQLTKK